MHGPRLPRPRYQGRQIYRRPRRPLKQRELCERHAAWLKANRQNGRAIPTPEKTVKRRLQDCDTALASDDGPIFRTVAKLVEALKRSIPEGTQTRGAKRSPAPRT